MGRIENGIYLDSAGKPAHRGVVQVEGKIYYAGRDGVLVKDAEKVIHHGMANGLVHHGSYYFDRDGVIDLASFKRVKNTSEKIRYRKKKKVAKKDKKMLTILLTIFAVLLVLFFGRGAVRNLLQKDGNPDTASPAASSTESEVSLPEYRDEVYLCTDVMKRFYSGELTLEEIEEAGGTAYSPFVFEYEIHNASGATFTLTQEGEEDPVTACELDIKSNKLVVHNLLTDTSYRYTVEVTDLKGETHGYEGSFKTADTNRFISLDGICNTRDIGGYDTLYGKKVKQGLLIRGTELDGLVESSYYLKDVADVDSFGFVCDFDLRASSIFNTTYVSRLGENVIHKFYNSPMYGGIFSIGNEELLKEIFTDLADAGNYPMYLHCTYGADRTGTIVFLLQGLLGVSEQDMLTEYELTGFVSKGYATGDNIQSVYSGLSGVAGETLNERIETYLVETVGVTKEQIEQIRSIFLEP